MSVGVTLAEFHADPERRLRAALIRRAAELGRAALGLSGWLGFLTKLGREGRGPEMTESRRAEVLRLTIRALAWATALRRRLLVENRDAKAAALLRPGFAPIRVEIPAVPESDGEASLVEKAPFVPGPPPEAAAVAFVATTVLDARLLTAERRAAGVVRTVVIRGGVPAKRAIRDCRKCAEDEAAKVSVAGVTMDEALANICCDLIGAAELLGETAAIDAVKDVVVDLRSRMAAYETAMTARLLAGIAAQAEADEADEADEDAAERAEARAQASGAVYREEMARRHAYREAGRTGAPLPDPW